jgi:hypothetical protein
MSQPSRMLHIVPQSALQCATSCVRWQSRPAAFVSAARLLLERIGCCVCAVDPNASLRFSRAFLAVRPCAAPAWLPLCRTAMCYRAGNALRRRSKKWSRDMTLWCAAALRCHSVPPSVGHTVALFCGDSAVMPCGCLWHGAAVLEYSLVGGALTPIGTAGRRLRCSRSTPSPAQWLRSLSLG